VKIYIYQTSKHQLNEYSQKIIDQLIAKWQKEMRNTLSNDDIKVKINRFDQIKQNIPTKIKAGNIVVPDKFTKPDEDTTQRFTDYLAKNRVNVRVRRSRGKDIDAACGQLANKGK
jgi:23S rRNA (adenine2503-C2)-methyltransferase